MKKFPSLFMATVLALSLTACGNQQSVSSSGESSEASSSAAGSTSSSSAESTVSSAESVSTNLSQIDMGKWLYNSDSNIYYQIGISYCETPADETYEKLAVFVPGDYFNATENGDETYTCSVNAEGTIGNYSSETAPIVFPVNTPGYSAQDALSDYDSSVEDYTDAGMIYVHAGLRGRDAGAPAGVTDAKAAIRYIRFNKSVIPGDPDKIFVFGMSGGGAQSAVIGASGNSSLYTPYLKAIGAVEGISDAVAGSMDWCPITNLDTADESYEWMMGVTRSNLSDEEQTISDDLAAAYAQWLNTAGIKDESGNVLTLEESDDGICQSGTYYDYLKSVIETSLNNFLSDTSWPYDASSADSNGPGGMGGNGPSGEKPDGTPPSGERSSEDISSMSDTDFEQRDQISRTETSSSLSLDGTYDTAQDYIDALNAEGEWVSYDSSTNTATITSVADFVKALKPASKSLGAFDQLDGGQGENTLFGYGDGNGAHFDSTLASILEETGNSYADEYASDLEKTDSQGNNVQTRLDMYTPLYYLMESYEGYKTSDVARYWRIRTGIDQGDTALTTEVNLALALDNYADVESVDFATVWGQGHTMAERTGDSTTNFIEWVVNCTKSE